MGYFVIPPPQVMKSFMKSPLLWLIISLLTYMSHCVSIFLHGNIKQCSLVSFVYFDQPLLLSLLINPPAYHLTCGKYVEAFPLTFDS